ncbi:MAG: hypothetical protein JOZ17_20725 [Acetobacteraceae bacterium]|nr:hypothetical protein [Acetobacteraceae bacterium]
MDLHLIVVRPFGGLARGDTVTDPKRISDILNSEHASHVVRVGTPEATAAAARIGNTEG